LIRAEYGPAEITELELREEIATLAEDLCTGYEEGERWRNRYPG
jgi:hypothetical protein